MDSALGDVEGTSWVTVCFSDNCSTVTLEAESFSGHGGVEVESEAHFCTTVSVAGD